MYKGSFFSTSSPSFAIKIKSDSSLFLVCLLQSKLPPFVCLLGKVYFNSQFKRFPSMAVWPGCFLGLCWGSSTWEESVGFGGRKLRIFQQAGSKKREVEGQGSQCHLPRHTPNVPASSHWAPFPKVSSTSQQCHGLGTKLLTIWTFGEHLSKPSHSFSVKMKTRFQSWVIWFLEFLTWDLSWCHMQVVGMETAHWWI